MLKVSRLADYATVVMQALGDAPLRSQSAAELAQSLNLALPTVRKVLKCLAEKKLLLTERGVNGGYRLARLPHEINLAQMIAAIDGPLALTSCSDTLHHANGCQRSYQCQLRSHWQHINYKIYQLLNQVTLADMTQSNMTAIQTKDIQPVMAFPAAAAQSGVAQSSAPPSSAGWQVASTVMSTQEYAKKEQTNK